MRPITLSAAAAVLIALAAGLHAGPARADDQVEAGRALVEGSCAGCHAIGRDDTGDNPDAPPFRTFASKWPLEHLEEALAEGIVVGHGGAEMPEFVFDPDEIAAIIAYLHTVQVPVN